MGERMLWFSRVSVGVILSGAVLGALPLPAAAEVLDFDDIAFHQFLSPTRYLDRGVVLASDGAAIYSNNSALSHSPPIFIAASEDPRFRNAQADIIVTFWLDEGDMRGAVDFVSFRIVDSEGIPLGVWDAWVEDYAGNVLDSLQHDANTALVELEAGTAEIHRLVFSPSTDGEGFDTLTFSEIAAVPEPSSAAAILVGSGVLLVGARFRARRVRERRSDTARVRWESGRREELRAPTGRICASS